jgi:hypothetical protein
MRSCFHADIQPCIYAPTMNSPRPIVGSAGRRGSGCRVDASRLGILTGKAEAKHQQRGHDGERDTRCHETVRGEVYREVHQAPSLRVAASMNRARLKLGLVADNESARLCTSGSSLPAYANGVCLRIQSASHWKSRRVNLGVLIVQGTFCARARRGFSSQATPRRPRLGRCCGFRDRRRSP